MKTSIRIQKPCTQNFSSFLKTKNGGYCKNCKKEVIDFSNSSNQEIMDFLQSTNEKLCGRFRSSQIHEPAELSKTSRTVKRLGFAAVTLLTLTATPELSAQSLGETSATEQTQQFSTLKGRVMDDQGLPLPGANVVLKGSTIRAVTDFDGKFEFPKALAKGDVLQFSYIGFEPKEYEVPTNEEEAIEITITFKASDIMLMGEISFDEPYSSKPKKYKSIFKK